MISSFVPSGVCAASIAPLPQAFRAFSCYRSCISMERPLSSAAFRALLARVFGSGNSLFVFSLLLRARYFARPVDKAAVEEGEVGLNDDPLQFLPRPFGIELRIDRADAVDADRVDGGGDVVQRRKALLELLVLRRDLRELLPSLLKLLLRLRLEAGGFVEHSEEFLELFFGSGHGFETAEMGVAGAGILPR